MFFSGVLILSKEGYEVPSDIWYRLSKMLEFILYYTKPNGLAPIIGDQDDARLHPFSQESNLDHTNLLALGAVVFDRADFKIAASKLPLEACMMLDIDSEIIFNNLQTKNGFLTSKAFPDAGFYIIRQGRDYMFINNSGKSKYAELGSGTHTHSDLLSFELFIDDKSFIVDPGTYVYSSSPEERMLFRSTSMHNTIVIDGHNQNTLDRNNLWDFKRDAIPKHLQWEDTEDRVIYVGEHNGYEKLSSPVIHCRRIEYFKHERKWVIEDSLSGSGVHYVELYLHFDIGIDIGYSDNLLSTQCDRGTNIDIHFRAEKGLHGTIKDGWVSKAYSSREKAKVFCLHGEVDCPMQIVTVIDRRSE